MRELETLFERPQIVVLDDRVSKIVVTIKSMNRNIKLPRTFSHIILMTLAWKDALSTCKTSHLTQGDQTLTCHVNTAHIIKGFQERQEASSMKG